MCIFFWSTSHPKFELVAASNRDEFLARPAVAARFHSFRKEDNALKQHIISGVDATGNGTWLGINTTSARWGVLTNIPDPSQSGPRPSRGDLVKNWLLDARVDPIDSYLDQVNATKSDFSGFNLIIGELSLAHGLTGPQVRYITNRAEPDTPSAKDVTDQGGQCQGCTISNTTLEAHHPWPKVVEGNKKFQEILNHDLDENGLIEELLKLLSIRNEDVQKHGERGRTILVPPVNAHPNDDAKAEWYATRTQTIILVSRRHQGEERRLSFVERDAFINDDTHGWKWSGVERRMPTASI